MKSLALLLVAALLATGWGVFGTRYQEYFKLPEEFNNIGGNMSSEQNARFQAAMLEAKSKNMTLLGAIFGGGLGLLMGASAGIAYSGRTVLAAVLGVLLGAGAGAAGGYLNVQIFTALRASETDRYLSTVAAHGAQWMMIGLAVGVAASIASRTKKSLLVTFATTLCGAVAGGLFPFLSGIVAPLANVDQILPDETLPKVLWYGLTSLLMAVAAWRVLQQPSQAASPLEKTVPAGSPTAS